MLSTRNEMRIEEVQDEKILNEEEKIIEFSGFKAVHKRDEVSIGGLYFFLDEDIQNLKTFLEDFKNDSDDVRMTRKYLREIHTVLDDVEPMPISWNDVIAILKGKVRSKNLITILKNQLMMAPSVGRQMVELIENEIIRLENIKNHEVTAFGEKDINDFIYFLESHPEITSLYILNSHIGVRGMQRLMDLRHLRELHIDESDIGGDKGAEILATSENLVRVSLISCGVEARGAKALANSQNISFLDLSFNKIGDEGVAAFANSKVLNNLKVAYCKLTDTGVISLAQGDNAISLLEASANNLTDASAVALAAKKNLASLDVVTCDIKDVGITALAASSSLASLNVNGNSNITYAGYEAILHNKTLFSFLHSGIFQNNLYDNSQQASNLYNNLARRDELSRRYHRAVRNLAVMVSFFRTNRNSSGVFANMILDLGWCINEGVEKEVERGDYANPRKKMEEMLNLKFVQRQIEEKEPGLEKIAANRVNKRKATDPTHVSGKKRDMEDTIASRIKLFKRHKSSADYQDEKGTIASRVKRFRRY